MQLLISPRSSWRQLGLVLTQLVLVQHANSAPNTQRRDVEAEASSADPFAVLDPQNWVNPANMTWADWKAPPNTSWADPSRKGSTRNFNIALVTVDNPDKPFTITLETGATIFNNPQPAAGNISREDVPAFYRDFLNTPGTLNKGHTLHEYWMSDSQGRFGVDLTSFGPYRMPLMSYQYGVEDWANPGACPTGQTCNFELRDDALGAWRADVGDAVADSFELVFILFSGQDESSTWQEFGEMKFQTKEDIPDSFGPPVGSNVSHVNYAKTRYVEWSSFAAASTIWPNAGDGSSTQAESSGMGTFAHECSHLLGIGDNYNNPYGVPLRRAFTGPWSMMSRGSFNGPGGPHTRWQIPPQEGGSMGSHHTIRDKAQLGLIGDESILQLSREALPASGPVTARITARSVDITTGLLGIKVEMNSDNSPTCSIDADVFCDGGGYNAYFLEVIDRLGADSFTPDHGVMISKSKEDLGAMFQWTIDANPQDIRLLDFYRPDGTPSYITLGDYRQLSDALFHAGSRSGSEFEYVDAANDLHFYIVDIHRDESGILSYTTAVRSTAANATDPHKHGAVILPGLARGGLSAPLKKGVTCSFQLFNSGTYSSAAETVGHPEDVSAYLKTDVYRLKATVEGSGWNVTLPNELTALEYGKSVTVSAAVSATDDAAQFGTVKLTVTSESDPGVVANTICVVNKYVNLPV